jgi:hypothetical protein
MAREPRSLTAGRPCLKTPSRAAPRSAAITARAEVRNNGEKPPTATRVAGSEPLKMITPRKPLPHPSVVRCMALPLTPDVPESAMAATGTIPYRLAEVYGSMHQTFPEQHLVHRCLRHQRFA